MTQPDVRSMSKHEFREFVSERLKERLERYIDTKHAVTPELLQKIEREVNTLLRELSASRGEPQPLKLVVLQPINDKRTFTVMHEKEYELLSHDEKAQWRR